MRMMLPSPRFPSGKSACASRKGQLALRFDLDAWRRDLLDQGLLEISVDGGIAARAGLLADMHGDPADRLIVATALEGHRLVTARPADTRLARPVEPVARDGVGLAVAVAAALFCATTIAGRHDTCVEFTSGAPAWKRRRSVW